MFSDRSEMCKGRLGLTKEIVVFDFVVVTGIIVV